MPREYGKFVSETGELGMADKKALRIFGFVLGGITIAVALVAAVAVQAQIDGGVTPAAMNSHTLLSRSSIPMH
jgi:hypothetical protein